MSKISDKLNIINSAKEDIKTAIENKGVTVGDIGIQEYANKINQIKTPPTKGVIIEQCDSNGFATDVSVVGIESLPNYAFATYSPAYANFLTKQLANINLPDDLKSIGTYSFYYCNKLAISELPDSVETIGDYAFRFCSNLLLNKLPENLKTIGDYAFAGCSNMPLSKMSSNVTDIGQYAFQNCTNLCLTELHEGLKTINNDAFNGCTNLAIKVIPSTVSTLTTNCFRSCTNLTEITWLSNNPFFSGTTHFYDCTNLSKFVLPNVTKVISCPYGLFTNTAIANGTGYIYFPDDLVDEYKSKWTTYASQIKGISELPTE